jgi:hypothetical protein
MISKTSVFTEKAPAPTVMTFSDVVIVIESKTRFWLEKLASFR